MANMYSESVLTFIVILLFETTTSQWISPKNPLFKQSQENCENLAKNYRFDFETAVRHSWRIYYTWQMDFRNICRDVKIKKVTATIVNRFYNDLYDDLIEQPPWGSATLYMVIGKKKDKEELLLFAEGTNGRFLVVPYLKAEIVTRAHNQGISIITKQMRLLANGKYLLFLDCTFGMGFLATRLDMLPDRREILSIVADLKLGPEVEEDGMLACLQDLKNHTTT